MIENVNDDNVQMDMLPNDARYDGELKPYNDRSGDRTSIHEPVTATGIRDVCSDGIRCECEEIAHHSTTIRSTTIMTNAKQNLALYPQLPARLAPGLA